MIVDLQPQRTQRTQSFLPPLSYTESLDLADKDINDNLDIYQERFLQGDSDISAICRNPPAPVTRRSFLRFENCQNVEVATPKLSNSLN